MWWNMPEAGEQQGEAAPVRSLAIGTMRRRQRTVLTLVALHEVRPNPDQPRKHFDPEKLAELAASIKTHGLLQPIVIRSAATGFDLVAGERRFRAAEIAGLSHIPALVRDVEDPIELALIENLQREDLSPLEEAQGLALLIERHGYTHRQVADILGKSRPYVSNILALTRLPETVKEDLQRDDRAVPRELLMGVARQENPEAAVALWRRLQIGLLSVRRFREEQTAPAPERRVVRELLSAARRLNRVLARLETDAIPPPEAPRVARILRRTQRLAQRHLAGLGPPGTSGSGQQPQRPVKRG